MTFLYSYIISFDVTNTELQSLRQGDVNTSWVVYLKQPHGFEKEVKLVCRFKKALLELKQVSPPYSQNLTTFLLLCDYPYKSYANLFIYIHQSIIFLVTLIISSSHETPPNINELRHHHSL